MSAEHVAVVNSIYQAFGAGDVPSVLEHMAPDVDWEYAWVGSPMPWLQPGRGPAHVAEFLKTMAEQLEFRAFDVNYMLAGDGVVVALVSLEARVRSTGRVITEVDEPQIWHFDEASRVVRFRHAADTLQHAEALGFEVRAPAVSH